MRRNLDKRFNARLIEAYQTGPTADGGLLIRAATADSPAEILVYDVIGADWFGEGVTAKGVMSALADAGGDPITVRINSPGGDVFEGLAIYNNLKAYAGEVNVVVDGIAASAASVIAMAGSTVSMGEGAMLMIHNASTIAIGNRHDFAATAATLGKVDGQLADIYARFTGGDAAHFATLMDAETYLTAEEAKAEKMATSITPAPAKPKAVAVAPIVAETAAEPDPELIARRRRALVARAR